MIIGRKSIFYSTGKGGTKEGKHYLFRAFTGKTFLVTLFNDLVMDLVITNRTAGWFIAISILALLIAMPKQVQSDF